MVHSPPSQQHLLVSYVPEGYPEYPIGMKVKIADLEDNMDIRRLNEITDEDVARLRKYFCSWQYLIKLG